MGVVLSSHSLPYSFYIHLHYLIYVVNTTLYFVVLVVILACFFSLILFIFHICCLYLISRWHSAGSMSGVVVFVLSEL